MNGSKLLMKNTYKDVKVLIRTIKLIPPTINNTEQFVVEFWKYHKRKNNKRNVLWFSILAVIFCICWLLSKN